MKQKIVIKLWMDGQKCRSNVMKIVNYILKLLMPYEILWKISTAKIRINAMKKAASFPGVLSVALGGEEKNELIVTGEGMDAANLVTLIRQNVAFAEVLSFGPDAHK